MSVTAFFVSGLGGHNSGHSENFGILTPAPKKPQVNEEEDWRALGDDLRTLVLSQNPTLSVEIVPERFLAT